MIITVAPSVASKAWKAKTVSWGELVSMLSRVNRTSETMAEYKAMSKEDKGRVKDIGGFVGGRLTGKRRVKGAVLNRCLVTLDADEAYDGQFEDYCVLYEDAVLAYSTHSSTLEKPRLRFVFPLNRAVTPEEYGAIARKLGERIGMETLDATTFQDWRAMYWPSCPLDGEQLFFKQDGEPVDADAVLSEYGEDEAWRLAELWPRCPKETEVVRRETKTAGDPTEKPGIVGMFCRAYDIHSAIETFLPDVYTEAGEGRYTYAAGSTFGGAVVYEDKWLYSNHATDPCSMQLCNAWDLVRIHKFGELDVGQEEQEVGRRPSQLKMQELAAGDPGVRRVLAEDRMQEVRESMADLVSVEGPSEKLQESGSKDIEKSVDVADGGAEAEDEIDLSWTEGLSVNRKTGECDATIDNAKLILHNDPNLCGALAYNLMGARPVLRKGVPWHRRVENDRRGDDWTDTDNAFLRAYMEKVWKYVGKDRIQDAFDIVCHENAFHPVREYLSGLRWDGQERLDTLFIRYMGAEDTEYTREVTRKWMCAAVKRVFEPGCKFDQILMLIGEQGIGKSTMARILSRGWFTDSLGRMDGSKESYERLMGTWIVELGELAAAKRSEVDEIKNFITKQSDTFRRAYGREIQEYPRQCVFFGTTNNFEVLRDITGDRRSWVLDVKGMPPGEHSRLEEEVDQLWAEAVVRYRAGEKLYLSGSKVQEEAKELQRLHSIQNEDAGFIQEYLDKPIPMNWEEMSISERRDWISGDTLLDVRNTPTRQRDCVCISEIRVELYGETLGKGDKRQSMAIADTLNVIQGWKKSGQRRLPIYGRQWVYTRTD